ncbi:MAG TPA: aldehyde dehydrogenase [Anaeromyxobacteraceae bacterium]|nr:aldehyde dehydrogenase [Anaeromyxobacteraceae bacterium]
MPVALTFPRPTERARLEESVSRVRDRAGEWARLPLREKTALARALAAGTARLAERSVAAACAAKGIPAGSPLEGEEWLAGPYVTLRILAQLARSLESLERSGNTEAPRPARTAEGRLSLRVFPGDRLDSMLFVGASGEVVMEEGVDEAGLEASRARFYRQPDHQGRLCLVLGAGNVNSIPAADVLTKLFNEGKVCVLKLNPVNAYLGPFLEEAFAPAVGRGFLSVVYGGAEEGALLAGHPAVEEVHVTGSDRTHDLMVWGPPGPERAERMARGTPLLAKEVTSELGNVTPVILVPGPYTDRQLGWQADDVAGMVTNNASFNCIAAKMLVTPRGWPARERFLDLVMRHMALVPPRQAWYPGAADRWRSLTAGRERMRTEGGGEGTLPWTLIQGLDAGDPAEKAFRVEPFCSILSEVPLGSADPVEFLDAAVDFCNRRLWGTLAAALVVHPATLSDPGTGPAVERAIARLRYGTVALNTWPGLAFAIGNTPWGGAPGSPLTDIQSGRGWVHNTLMLERVEKVVLRHPVTSPVKLPWFPSHRTAHVLGRRLTRLAAGNSLQLPGVVAAALRG